MKNEYISLIEDIDEAVAKQFGIIKLHFKIIGYAALALAGLPERGTKDIDTLKHEIKTEAVVGPGEQEIIDFLVAEFGKKSPGEARHDLYLDLVDENIAWFPPHPRFISEKNFSCIKLSRLHPTDTCVSKTFSMYKESYDRPNDRKDVIDALSTRIIDFTEYVRRVDETFLIYEMDARAPRAYPRVYKFITEELIPEYGSSDIALTYSLPSWMENM
ncbi:MAG: DUF6036 family nucleotidyltransferase [Pseudomonadota bacterium]